MKHRNLAFVWKGKTRLRIPINEDTLFGEYRGALRLDPTTLRLHLCFGPIASPQNGFTGLVDATHRPTPALLAMIVSASDAAWLCGWWRRHRGPRAHDDGTPYAVVYGLPGAFVQLCAEDVSELKTAIHAAYTCHCTSSECYSSLDDLTHAPSHPPPVAHDSHAEPLPWFFARYCAQAHAPMDDGGVERVALDPMTLTDDMRYLLLADADLPRLPCELFTRAPRLLESEWTRVMRAFAGAMDACEPGKDPDRLLKPHIEHLRRPLTDVPHVFDVDAGEASLTEWYTALLTLNDADMPERLVVLEARRLHQILVALGAEPEAIEVGWHNDGAVRLVQRAGLRAKAHLLHVALSEIELKIGRPLFHGVPRWDVDAMRANISLRRFRTKGDGSLIVHPHAFGEYFVGVTRE